MQRISLLFASRNPMLCILLILFVIPASARQPHYSGSQGARDDFDYYLLSLSWAPNFCATHTGNSNECGVGHHATFVVHGLWPQGEQGRLNQPCQHTSPVSQDVVRYALNFYPDAGLVQHEWQCHGVYSGLAPQDYFSAVGRAYQSLHIPATLTGLPKDTEENAASLVLEFQQSNAAPPNAFVTSCHSGELVGVEACFTKDLKLRSCAPSLRSCSGSLLLRAPH